MEDYFQLMLYLVWTSKNVPSIHHLTDFDNFNIPSGDAKTIIRLVLFSLSNNKNGFGSGLPVVVQIPFIFNSDKGHSEGYFLFRILLTDLLTDFSSVNKIIASFDKLDVSTAKSLEGVSKLSWALVFIFNMTFVTSTCAGDGGWFSTSRSSKKSATSSNFSTSVDKFIVENEKWVENRIKPVPLWIDGDFDDRVSEFPNPNYGHLFNMTSLELFELFFTNYIIDLLIEETKKYSSFKNCLDQNITSDEIKCFIGILILSGYNQLPSKRNYWEQEQDVQNILVSNSMRGDKFFQIMKFIHCADNNEIKIDDKTWKLRNLMKKIQTRCIENFVPVQNINYDESMIKYFGRHSCKQFIQGKPIRFGYKMWCLNSSDGYLINFDIYQGKLPGGKTTYENVFGKCTAPLIYFLENLSPEKRKLSYRIFCDNLFTSANLLSFLRDRGYSGTGTVRENRLGKDFPLMGKKLFLKKQRGECASTIEKNDCIIYARWMDNSVVTAASTSIGIKPISYVQRYFQKEKKKISVPRPLMIGEYNKYMGGTDLMDQNISTYRIGIRGKKWWWPIFTWLIDMCINNAWILQKKVKPNISQLQFRREIVRMLLTKYGTAPKVEGRPSTSISSLSCNRVSDDVRYDGKEHLVIPTPQKKRRRCAGERCSSSGRTMCWKCNVGLCVECFKLFHTKTY
ncbi:hypothetical protein QTP88_029696 [Uroleucon formosanum]